MLPLQEAAATGAHPLTGTVADLIWLVPLFPLIGFLINGWLSLKTAARIGPADPAAHHDHHAEGDAHGHGAHAGNDDHGPDHAPPVHRYAKLVSIIGPAVLWASFGLSVSIFAALAGAHAEAPFVRTLFSWIPAGDLRIDAALQVDQLSMIMTMVITGVGSLIHVFSVGYMREDPGYPRYFAYLNLFVFFMLLLVLGANYPVMFVGWEGVGLCSYLLIGFWFSDKANADAGKKAFIVNRIGDFGFLVAMFLLFAHLGTLDFTGVNEGASQLSGTRIQWIEACATHEQPAGANRHQREAQCPRELRRRPILGTSTHDPQSQAEGPQAKPWNREHGGRGTGLKDQRVTRPESCQRLQDTQPSVEPGAWTRRQEGHAERDHHDKAHEQGALHQVEVEQQSCQEPTQRAETRAPTQQSDAVAPRRRRLARDGVAHSSAS
jgi:hypothetical protein